MCNVRVTRVTASFTLITTLVYIRHADTLTVFWTDVDTEPFYPFKVTCGVVSCHVGRFNVFVSNIRTTSLSWQLYNLHSAQSMP